MRKIPVHVRQWSIVLKTVLLVCGLVTLLVGLGGGLLIRFELNLIESFRQQHVTQIYRNLDERQAEEQRTLREFIEFIGQILAQASAEHLFKKNVSEIQSVLRPYIKHPSILAASILDQNNAPVSAMWKEEHFTGLGERLPEHIAATLSQAVDLDVSYYDRNIGRLVLYYSDASLARKIDALKANALAESQAFTEKSEQQVRQGIFSQLLGTGVILLALILSLMSFLRIFVRKPLLLLVDAAHRLSGFDLTLDIHATPQDEVGRVLSALREMVQSFRTLLSQVQRSGIQVMSSAAELSATAREQEATMATQVEATNNVLTSVLEISEVTTELADTMQHVVARFQETVDFANSGQTDLTTMEKAMRHMESASTSISERLQAINEKAENITSVVTTITKVSEQTNLLSLNAAIEAEKAGEYGRGFTVVSREIRRLADQTDVATLDIEQMVKEMQAAVLAGVMEMDKFIAEVRHSASTVERISLQLSRIINQVQSLSPSFEQVNTAMEHQAGHVQQINTSMGNLTEDMQETKTSLHETYTVIEQLYEAARHLQEEVSRFKVN